MFSSARNKLPQAHRALTWAKNVIVAYLALVAGTLSYGLIMRNTFVLFLVLMPLSPLGLIMTTAYRAIKARMVRHKANRLANIFDKAANSLEMTPPQITDFDILLSVEPSFVWQGAVAPFLAATVRLMHQTNSMLLSEELGRSKEWTKDSALSPFKQIASYVRTIAATVRSDDRVRAFETIGDLMALSILLGREYKPSHIERFNREDFFRICTEIGALLRQRRFFDAEVKVEDLLQNIIHRGSADVIELRWQSLITYWLSLRLSFLEVPFYPGPTRLWAGPSRVLASQLEDAITAYAKSDYVGLTEIVYESFDWQARVPRFLLE